MVRLSGVIASLAIGEGGAEAAGTWASTATPTRASASRRAERRSCLIMFRLADGYGSRDTVVDPADWLPLPGAGPGPSGVKGTQRRPPAFRALTRVVAPPAEALSEAEAR